MYSNLGQLKKEKKCILESQLLKEIIWLINDRLTCMEEIDELCDKLNLQKFSDFNDYKYDRINMINFFGMAFIRFSKTVSPIENNVFSNELVTLFSKDIHTEFLTDLNDNLIVTKDYFWHNIKQWIKVHEIIAGWIEYYNVPYIFQKMYYNASEFTFLVTILASLKYFDILKAMLYGAAETRDYWVVSKFKSTADKLVSLDKSIFDENGEFDIIDSEKRAKICDLMNFPDNLLDEIKGVDEISRLVKIDRIREKNKFKKHETLVDNTDEEDNIDDNDSFLMITI